MVATPLLLISEEGQPLDKVQNGWFQSVLYSEAPLYLYILVHSMMVKTSKPSC